MVATWARQGEEPQKVNFIKVWMAFLKTDRTQLRISGDWTVERLDPQQLMVRTPEELLLTFDNEIKASTVAADLEKMIAMLGDRERRKKVAQEQQRTETKAKLESPPSEAPKAAGVANRRRQVYDDFGEFACANTLPKVGGFIHGQTLEIRSRAKPAGVEAPSRPQTGEIRRGLAPGRTDPASAVAAAMDGAGCGVAQAAHAADIAGGGDGGGHPYELRPRERLEETPEEKRRKIDERCAETPPRFSQPHSRPTLRRAPAPRGPSWTLSPQYSSTYRSYRTQERFGLRNLGNTCYLNAITQAVASLAEFVGDLRLMAKAVPSAEDGPLLHCTADIMQQLAAAGPHAEPVNPGRLRDCIAVASPMYGSNEQQDAHEFFLDYVNQLHDEMLTARNQWLGAHGGDEAGGATISLATSEHLDSEVRKHLTCTACGHTHDIVERFRDFSLDFERAGEADKCSVSSMFDAYFAPEVLEVTCEKCGGATSRMEKVLETLPRTLVLHLKRFVPNVQRQRYDKWHREVSVPQRLELQRAAQPAAAGAAAAAAASSAVAEGFAAMAGASPGRLPARPLAPARDAADAVVCAGGRLPAKIPETSPAIGGYTLRAVVAHEGPSPFAGHYVCYSRREGCWKLYDDSIVKEARGNLQDELGKKAYILFYVREGQ